MNINACFSASRWGKRPAGTGLPRQLASKSCFGRSKYGNVVRPLWTQLLHPKWIEIGSQFRNKTCSTNSDRMRSGRIQEIIPKHQKEFLQNSTQDKIFSPAELMRGGLEKKTCPPHGRPQPIQDGAQVAAPLGHRRRRAFGSGNWKPSAWVSGSKRHSL